MKAKFLLATLLLAAAMLLAAPLAQALPAGATPAQKTTAKLVYGLLSDSRYAYRPQPLDDALSADIFKRYLEALDGSKVFLTASDVAGFAPYKTRFDDAIKSGDLSPAYAMFERYRKRVQQRVAFSRGLLDEQFDFTTDTRWHYDREEAKWSDDAALDTYWRHSVMNDWLRLKLAGKKPDEIRKTLDKRYENLAQSVAQLKGEDVFETFMNAYTGSIDPHTGYFTPYSAENFNLSMSLSLEGIGAVLQKRDDVVVIREVVAGGPASKSGQLQTGDRIVGVGQGADGEVKDVIGWRIDEVVKLIRGPKGSQVRLDVLPVEAGMDAKPVRITLTRAKIQLEDKAAEAEIMTIPASPGAPSQRIGVIKLPAFYQDFAARRRNEDDYASATRDVARFLREFKQQDVDGVVLDLRNNGGGSLNEAIELTGLFIDQGPVVQVRESGGRVSVERDRESGVAWDGPLAVLINRSSASASEIFAGAIQDYGRGLVIGETSFGKGTVQNLVDLDRWPGNEEAKFGQLKLTIAQFFRADGGSTQHKGVVPDIRFPASVDASEYGEATYDNALPWTRIAAVPHIRYGNFKPLLPKLETLHEARVATNQEFQWWMEDVARYRKERDKTSISLNEEVRRAERAKDAKWRETRHAERVALGLELDPLIRERLDDGLQAGERDVVKDVAREEAAEESPDPLLRESAAILADAINLLADDEKMAALVLPASATADHWTD